MQFVSFSVCEARLCVFWQFVFIVSVNMCVCACEYARYCVSVWVRVFLQRWRKWLWPCRTLTWAWRWETKGCSSLSFHMPWQVCVCVCLSLYICVHQHVSMRVSKTHCSLIEFVPAVIHHGAVHFGEYRVLQSRRKSFSSALVLFICVHLSLQAVIWSNG